MEVMATELGDFLRTRRAAVSPAAVGLVSYGARRVPGLRREELAHLAGVSPTYYTRLEQADHHNVSDSVLDALARVLTLTDAEHEHLRRLARPEPRPVRRRRVERPRPAALGLVRAAPGPALLVDHRQDVLAWNALGHRLVGLGYPFEAPDDVRDRPNFARMFFLALGGRDLYAEPDQMARQMVGFLRYSSGLHPDDHELSCLVGELVQRSDQFAALWAKHQVLDCGHGVKKFQHPLVGRLDLTYEAMPLPESSHRMVLYHAEPGTPAADALALLARH
ncbi:helix-turn-helix transcriptional regulator [Pseudofrankia sp. BMG5.37]|uniref:helix-turn-helix transcriptional regulator n=1 Tax=Pseudofrankia sp. BMG5.37 TaxID=3050035 RepID=UPI0037CBE4C4